MQCLTCVTCVTGSHSLTDRQKEQTQEELETDRQTPTQMHIHLSLWRVWL